MNADPVLIVDDDVDMEPVVILDEDDENIKNEKIVGVPCAPTVETIDLDDETPIITGVETIKNNATTLAKKSEITFKNNLENNRLMDKIVTRCINMENATGMPRVVYKTLLPLYRDTNNRFKESDAFRSLLRKTYKLLMRDPDHKFLHIKTLCEELKSGGLRRKVPFVTLNTNLKNNGSQYEDRELTSTSREINHNNVANKQPLRVYGNTRKKVCGTATKRKVKQAKPQSKQARDRIQTRSLTIIETEKTDIIDLDDSETETADEENQKNDGQNDVIIIEETEPSDQRNDNLNTIPQETKEDSNKENNDKREESPENDMDYELLIPTNVCNVDRTKNDKIAEKIGFLEKRIAYGKKMIDKLEEEEVRFENPNKSPYYLCSKYKEDIVLCYKQICELKGECTYIEKRCKIRLRVAEGHPPGPAKALEEFLNYTIDATGEVEFPDFSDVVKCVVKSNLSDNLGWSAQQVIQEAVALFRQCGQVLRKRRQKREYMDLMSLIRNKDETDDPAEKDPVLLAKLEENKRMAQIKEEEILERYVNMEKHEALNRYKNLGTPHVAGTAEFESDKDSSDSESETEENITVPINITNSTVNNQPETGECSGSNINLGLYLRNDYCEKTQNLQTNGVVNNLVVPSTAAPATLNPMLMNLLIIPPSPLYFVTNTITSNQFAIRESSVMNANSNNSLVVLPTNTISSTTATMHNERGAKICSDKEVTNNSNLSLTMSDTVESSNTATTNGNSETSSINTMKNIESTECTVDIELFNKVDVQNNISSTSDGVDPNSDSVISRKDKTEDIVNTEDVVKKEPLDIQSMLDELGDGFVCQVFDVEDPFLVIEISSDGFTDDEEL